MTDNDHDVEEGDCYCQGGSCATCPEPIADPIHSSLLRILGSITFIFGIIELGLGGTVYNFLNNVKLGGWWCGISVVICGFAASFPRNKGWVTVACVFASFSCVLTAIGAFNDGSNSIIIQNLTACSAFDGTNSKFQNYGDSSDYSYSYTCMRTAKTTVSDACYCVSRNGAYCGEYILSSYANALNLQCGDILKNYANALTSSAAFCALSLIMSIALSLLSCVVLCCPVCKSRKSVKALTIDTTTD